MELLQGFFGLINDLTWGWALVPFLVVMGLFFTIFSGFVQFRYFKRMFRVLSGKLGTDDPKGISGREALLVSVGGRVGGGNIAGVAVAISIGGPGAVFWMWAIALVGMATSVIECSLAQLYKERAPDGSFRGGPARSIIHGLGRDYRWLAIVYAVCLLFAFSIGFNAFQGNTVAGAAQDSLGIDRLYSGIVISILTLIIIYGGIRRIAKVADIVVPIMAIGYLLMAVVVIVINIPDVPGVLISIVRGAFGLDEAIGGGHGSRACPRAPARAVLERGGTRLGAERRGDRRRPTSRQPGHHAVALRIHRHDHHLHVHRAGDPARRRLRPGGGKHRRG